MSKEFARAFYDSTAWRQTRKAYASSVGGLCERCLRSGRYVPGVIVHHIKHLDDSSYGDPKIALDWSNLELLCRECHNEIHKRGRALPRRYCVDSAGRVVSIN